MNSGADALYYKDYGQGQATLHPTNGEPLEVTESRFLKDDLNQLAGLGLFSVEPNGDGGSLLGITRNAVRYVETIDTKGSVAADTGNAGGGSRKGD